MGYNSWWPHDFLAYLGESFSIFLLFTITGIMGFASLAFAVSDNPIYSVYSVNSHHDAGTYAGFVHADNSNCSASISNRKSTVSY